MLAYRRGSIPEIIDDGMTGFICDDLSELVRAVSRLPVIQRHHCRQAFEARFTVARMAKDYVALYENVLCNKRRPNRFMNPRALRNRRHVTHIGLDTFQENVA